MTLFVTTYIVKRFHASPIEAIRYALVFFLLQAVFAYLGTALADWIGRRPSAILAAVIEVAATTGVVLTGRFRAGDAETRQMGHGFAFGGHASLQVPWVRLSLEAEQLPSFDSLSAPVNVARGTLCAVAYPMAICADGRAEQTRATVGTSEPLVTAAYAGITLGFTGSN